MVKLCCGVFEMSCILIGEIKILLGFIISSLNKGFLFILLKIKIRKAGTLNGLLFVIRLNSLFMQSLVESALVILIKYFLNNNSLPVTQTTTVVGSVWTLIFHF